ncbi:MAG: hypothetical protein KAU50_10370, partial [Candidatus Marinimicrobia bacterium]|nr:hypothetical protein [Candidatus Neomarinimicrobiota bacterium]
QESGDLIFGARVTLAKTAAPLAISLSLSNGLESYAFNDLKMVTNDGPISIPALNVSADYLNADGAINPGEKAHLSLSLLNEGKYAHSGLKANLRFSGPVETSGENYQYISVVEPGVHASVMYDMVDSDTYSEVIIYESAHGGNMLTANIILSDDLGNEWEALQSILIEPYPESHGYSTDVTHSAGSADASVIVKVINYPQITGDNYEISFSQQDSVNHWNLRNTTTDAVLYENMLELGTYNNGNAPEGFVVKIEGIYAAPFDYNRYNIAFADGTTDEFSASRALFWSNSDPNGKPYIITSYAMHGWGESARAVDTWGAGTEEIALLEDDYELRFTGVYEAPVVEGSDTLHRIQPGTGSIATFVGARQYDPATHPMRNDVSTDANADGHFLVRIPFEVWNKETGEQIDILIYDRLQNPANGGDFYAFNPSDRMYCYVLNRPYSETIAAVESGGADEAYLTWNLVFWNTDWQIGDTVAFNYSNPIQPGVDLFTFSTSNLQSADNGVKPVGFSLSQNYPNPFNPVTQISYAVPRPATVHLVVYDLLGREVARLVDGHKQPGPHQYRWNGRDDSGRELSSGIYIARFMAPGYSNSIKMLLLK